MKAYFFLEISESEVTGWYKQKCAQFQPISISIYFPSSSSHWLQDRNWLNNDATK